MKIEHKLSPAVAEHVRKSREQIEQLEQQYLMAVGQSREVQIELAARRRELSASLAAVVYLERLPAPVAPYMLNSDGTALVGEVADPPALPDAPVAGEPIPGTHMINGSGAARHGE